MHIEITQVIVVFVTLLSAVITGIVFPLIRSKVSAARWELMKEFAVAGVQAAEILLGAGNGKKKFEQAKRYIEQQCKEHGIKIAVGSSGNTMTEALKGIRLFGEVLSAELTT